MTERAEITDSERTHLHALTASRQGWTLALISPLFCDEGKEQHQHSYTKAHPYVLGMREVLKEVCATKPTKVLDIGSQIAQNVAVAHLTDLTMVDVRPVIDPALGLKTIQGTATAIPFADASQSLVTSMWVMCHVGDGRYGDALDVDGDVKFLREIHRVLAPGGIALLGLGPVDSAPGIIFNAHRIYTWEWLRGQFHDIGFTVLEEKEFPVENDIFIDPGWNRKMVCASRSDGRYAYAKLRKNA